MSYSVADVQQEQVAEIVALERLIQPHPWSLATFLLEFGRPNRIMLVARADATAVISGYVCGWFVADEVQLHNLGVAPAARGQGLGMALTRAFLERGRAAHAETAVLEVRMSNLPALSLYRRLGFSVVGWRPGYYESPQDDACMMTLGLQP